LESSSRISFRTAAVRPARAAAPRNRDRRRGPAVPVRDLDRAERLNAPEAREREDDAERAAGEREDAAFGEELPDAAPALDAERRADGDLALTAERS